MKKLITLLLVLTGMVSTASATQTVYLRTGSDGWGANWARFALYMFTTEGSANEWVDFTTSGKTGVLKADFDESKYNKMVLCQMNPNTTENSWSTMWRQSEDLGGPTDSPVLYDVTNISGDVSGKINPTGITPSTYSFQLEKDAYESEPIMPDYMDENDGASKALTSNGDFTYTLVVEGNIIGPGTYNCKVSSTDGHWYGDVDSGGDWVPVNITEAGKYTLTFTIDYLAQDVTAAALKTEDVNLSVKYVIAGDETLMGGHSWDTSGNYNVLDVTDGTGTLTINNLSLAATTYYYKAVKLLCNNGTKYKSIWASGDNKSFLFHRPSVWNATFTCTVADLNSATLNVTENPGYFLYGTQTRRMTENEGVYSCTLNNANGEWFGIVSSSDLDFENNISNWTKLIRPSGDSDKTLDWNSYSNEDIKEGKSSGSWMVETNNTVSIDFSYDPTNKKWSSTPYILLTLPVGAEGYATFSSAYDVTVDERLTARYATAANASTGTINWATYPATGIKAGQGALLSGGNEGWGYIFRPAASAVAPTTNLMKAITTTDKLAQSTLPGTKNYILAKKSDVLGFYLPASGDGSYVAAGTAYLQVPDDVGNAREFFALDGETTSIDAVKQEVKMNGQYFNLAGQRISQPTKGLYIVNGKKVIIK